MKLKPFWLHKHICRYQNQVKNHSNNLSLLRYIAILSLAGHNLTPSLKRSLYGRRIFLDFLYVRKHVQRYQNQLMIPLQHFFNLRYSRFKLPAAILEIRAFWEVYFGILIVCYSAHHILRESIEKPFLGLSQAPRIGAYFRNPPVLRGQAWYCSCLSWQWTGVRHFMWPRSRYRRPLQYKWGTGLCLRKKCLDINQRLIITFMPCPKKM